MFAGFAPGDEYEQNISLVKNPRCRKRSSSHPAFPKLYSKVFINSFIMNSKNPETLSMFRILLGFPKYIASFFVDLLMRMTQIF